MSVEITLYVGLYRSELITPSLSLSLFVCVQGGVLGKQGLMITTFMLDRYLAFTAATNILPDNEVQNLMQTACVLLTASPGCGYKTLKKFI